LEEIKEEVLGVVDGEVIFIRNKEEIIQIIIQQESELLMTV
jgi:hypothetical protein